MKDTIDLPAQQSDLSPTLPQPKEERQYVTLPTGVKQVLCPPDIPAFNPAWLSERETYLISRGWERDGDQARLPTFRDPKGSELKGEYRDVVELPVKGDDLHQTMMVQQYHVPPAVYSFTLEEALEIQRQRDAQGEDGATPLQRLGDCERLCNKLQRELEQTKARIKLLLQTHQLTFEGLKLGLRELIGA